MRPTSEGHGCGCDDCVATAGGRLAVSEGIQRVEVGLATLYRVP